MTYAGSAQADNGLVPLPVITDGAGQLHRAACRRGSHRHEGGQAVKAIIVLKDRCGGVEGRWSGRR